MYQKGITFCLEGYLKKIYQRDITSYLERHKKYTKKVLTSYPKRHQKKLY